jgi:hypothetical protein
MPFVSALPSSRPLKRRLFAPAVSTWTKLPCFTISLHGLPCLLAPLGCLHALPCLRPFASLTTVNVVVAAWLSM